MTDREVLIAMFDRAGVTYSAEEGGSLVVEAKKGDANLGYSDFVAVFYFNEDDSLKAVGAWE